MVGAVGKIVVRTVALAENHDRAELSAGMPGKKIEPWLTVPLWNGSAVKQAVEHLCSRFRSPCPQHENPGSKAVVAVKIGILDR